MTQLKQIPRAAQLEPLVAEQLPPKLQAHCRSVTELMVQIAPLAHIEVEPAIEAGLLHDLCKPWSADRLLDAAHRYGIPVSGAQRRVPKLLHGPVAAEECRRTLGIGGEAYEAIYWHTTGKEGLCMTGLALYVADFAEPLRTHPGAAQARALLEAEGFAAALRYVEKEKYAHICSQPEIEPSSAAFHAWLRGANLECA